MSTITLAILYNATQWYYHEVALAVGTVTAALSLFLLCKAYVTVSKNVKEKKKIAKKSLPKSSMGILETIQMMAGRKVPMQLFDMA